MTYVGLVPSEESSGDMRRQGSITKVGYSRVWHVVPQSPGATASCIGNGPVLERRQEGQPPDAVFRTGWGPMEGPFSFCVDNFKGYFSNLARFLGALVFLGYCHLASDKFEPDAANRYADTIAIRLQGNFRWPEITTYEEMNETWPDNLIVRSLITVMREDDPNAMPEVLSELRALSSLSLVS